MDDENLFNQYFVSFYCWISNGERLPNYLDIIALNSMYNVKPDFKN